MIIYFKFLVVPRELPTSQAEDFTFSKQKGPTFKWKAMKGFIPRLGIKSCTYYGALFHHISPKVFALHILKPVTLQLDVTWQFSTPHILLPMGELVFSILYH